MGLGRQIIDFIGLNQRNHTDEGRRIGQVPVVQGDFIQDVVDSRGVGQGSPAGDAVNLIALFQQELRKIGAVLTGDAGNQRNFRHTVSSNQNIAIARAKKADFLL